MPTIFMFGPLTVYNDDLPKHRTPGVNRGRKRGVTKSSKPRRKK